MRIRLFIILATLLLGLTAPCQAQLTAPTTRVEVAQLPPAGVASFDVDKAVNAYMARQTSTAKAKSDAYFEGGYVLQLVDLLYGLAIAALLLWGKLSSRMTNFAAARTQNRFLQVPIYAALYTALTTVLSLPLMIYEGFIREHQYGFSNQNFAQWAGEFTINFVVQLVAFVVLLTVLYTAARAAKRRWWLWGTGITVAFMVFFIMVAPVYIAPLTNHYSKLPESGLRNAILSMARANDIPAENVYVFDASKQSNRISANVSGLFGTTRISLNDNLLNRSTPSEVLAVLGHEMGHYVMSHVTNFVVWIGLLILAGFWFVDKAFYGLTRVFGGKWQVSGIDDPTGLPLVMALISVFFFFATPLTNTMIRTQEIQADIFGLNAVRQPDAFATSALKLGEYRKMSPTPLEEAIFFDHPSGRTRIKEAMRWKAEHLNDPDIMAGPISPQ
jgi:STE24 endopeptidase